MTQRAFHVSKCQLLAELETVLGIVTSKYTSGRYGPQSQGGAAVFKTNLAM